MLSVGVAVIDQQQRLLLPEVPVGPKSRVYHRVRVARSRVSTTSPFRNSVTVPVDWLTVTAIARVSTVIAAAAWCRAPRPAGRSVTWDFGIRYVPASRPSHLL